MVEKNIDFVARIFLYILIFWLPYSPAVIETCIIITLSLWFIKRLTIFFKTAKKNGQHTVGRFFHCLRPQKSSLDLPVLVFLCIAFLSAIFSSLKGASIHGFFSKTFEWFIVYYLFLEFFRANRHYTVAFTILVITTTAVCLDAFIQLYWTGKDIFFGNELLGERVRACFRHPNGLAGYLAVLLPIVISLMLTRIARFKKILLSILGGVMFCVIIFTYSRGALLAAITGIMFLLFHIRRKWCYSLGSGLLIMVLGFLLLAPGMRAKALDYRQMTVGWRFKTWQESFRMVKEKPLIGHGPNTFMRLFQTYRDKAIRDTEWKPTYAHNCYVQMAAEIGLLGLIGFLWIIVRLIILVRTVFIQKEDSDPQTRILILGLFSGIVVFLLHSFVDTNFYSLKLSVYFWALVGILVSLSQENKEKQACST